MTLEQKVAARFLWENSINALQLVAGAGTGKTTTLLSALDFATRYIHPQKIALITFTKKAAHEMKSRLGQKKDMFGFIGTMHSLAWQILRKKNFRLKVLEEPEKLLSKIIRENFVHLSHIPAELILTSPLLAKEEKQKIWEIYQKLKAKYNLVDFDEMIDMVTEANYGKGLFDAMLVDEFQDTSLNQVNFIKSFEAKKIFVVGDDWQSIYKFRGADVTISLHFEKYFTNSKRLFLTKNFRSHRKIVKLSNKAIQLSKQYIPKKLKSHVFFGKQPILYFQEKAHDIAEVIQNFQNYRQKKKDFLSRTFLVRTNFVKDLIKPYLWKEDQVLTIHAAKGLEFPHVTVFGVAPNFLPHPYGDYDEEVRIFYVAMSRAQKILEFVAFGKGKEQSLFLPFLYKNCKVLFLT